MLLGSIHCQPPQEGCPYEGLYHYPHESDCEKYYLCKNGTGTLEECPNGLLYQEHGAVYEFCAYYWKVDCPKGKTAREYTLLINVPNIIVQTCFVKSFKLQKL